MTTYPQNQNQNWTRTQAAPRRTPSADAPTVASYFPPPQAYGPQYVPAYAWSAEQPEFNSAPAAYAAPQPWYARPRVIAFAGAGFAVAAVAGLFGALHDSHTSAPVMTASHGAPAPAPAPAPKPAATPSTHTYRSTSHSSMSNSGYSRPVSHQTQPQTPPVAPPAPSQVQPDQSSQPSDPSQWNNSGSYWWNHSGDHDNRSNFWSWDRDHDNHWNFWNHDRDSDNSHSDSNQGGDSK